MKVFNKEKALRQIKLKQNKNTYIKKVSIVLSCFILLIGIMYFTFAKFEQSSEEYTLINGVVKYGGSGDIQLSYVVDGVSQNTPPAKGTGYIIKNVNCINADGIWLSDEWSFKASNITGKVKCNIEFEEATNVNITLYGAPGAVISYTDTTGNHTQTLDTTGKKENVEIGIMNNIIFEDTTVSKNPDNLTNNYTKAVNVTSETTDVYVMPENALYWYGFKSDNLEDMNSTNGWSASPWTSKDTVKPTYGINYITLKNNGAANGVGNTLCGVGSKSLLVPKYIHFIVSYTGESSGNYGSAIDGGFSSTKDRNGEDFNLRNYVQSNNSITHVVNETELSISGYAKIAIHRTPAVALLYALWYE